MILAKVLMFFDWRLIMTGLQACPICNCPFPPETNNREINEHIDQVGLGMTSIHYRFSLRYIQCPTYFFSMLSVLNRCVSLMLLLTGK